MTSEEVIQRFIEYISYAQLYKSRRRVQVLGGASMQDAYWDYVDLLQEHSNLHGDESNYLLTQK